MFKRTEGLRKKIINICVIGLGILIMGPCAVETCNNFNSNRTRYNLAESKLYQLIEYEPVQGTSISGQGSIYRLLGLKYDPNNPEKLSQGYLDIGLGKFGFVWNGREYTHEKF